MRTKTLLAAAAMLAAGFASSMAQSNVYSLNVVGYVNKVLEGAGNFSVIHNPLNSSSNTVSGLLTTLPTGYQVQKWNNTTADFDSYTRVPFPPGWSPGTATTTTLNPGEGFLVLSPGGAGNVTNTFVGEVLQGSLTNSFVAGYKLTGNLVPDSGPVDTLGLSSANVPNTTQLQQWNAAIHDYNSFTRVPFPPFWSPSVPSIVPGEAFFIVVGGGGPFNWVRNFTVQ
jgi:hypothetical protein